MTGKLPREWYQRGGRLGGLTRAANMTQEERTEAARKAALAGVAKRRAERERLGLPEPRTRQSDRVPAPTTAQLAPFMEQAIRELPETASELELRRRAILLRKHHIARLAFEAGRDDRS